MERLNGEIRDREKVMRGLKRNDTPILTGYQIYHNYIRPHQALDGKTPSEVAGIVIKGENKWLTIIQNACRNEEFSLTSCLKVDPSLQKPLLPVCTIMYVNICQLLNLLSTLDKHAETGLIVESPSGEKMVAFRTTTFLQLMDRLVGLAGYTVGATLLNQMGIDIGHSMFNHLKDEVKSDNDLVSLMDIVLAERGWGRCRALEKVETKDLTYNARTEGNPITGKHGRNEPMCHFIRGIYTGFVEAYLNKKAKSSEEITCVALGGPNCTFEITLEQ